MVGIMLRSCGEFHYVNFELVWKEQIGIFCGDNSSNYQILAVITKNYIKLAILIKYK